MKGVTMQENFFEKFPNAKVAEDGTPTMCPEQVYGGERKCRLFENCTDCWNRPLEEEE